MDGQTSELLNAQATGRGQWESRTDYLLIELFTYTEDKNYIIAVQLLYLQDLCIVPATYTHALKQT